MPSARRSIAGTSLALLAAATLAACGSDSAASEGSGESWTYTDGSGETVELDSRPTRIIAHAHAAAALMSFGIRPVGIYADTPIEEDPGLKDLDLEGIEILGETWGEVDVAKAAGVDPRPDSRLTTTD